MNIDSDYVAEDRAKNLIHELVWKAIDNAIKSDQLTASLVEQKDKCKHFESVVADVISLIDVEIGSFGSSPVAILSSCSDELANPAAKKDKFYSIVNSLRPLVGDDLLKERLEIETLEALKLISKKEVFNQKYIKIKTRLFYKQQKFNLLREETEGYSKLITELGQTNLNNKVLESIQSLIGCFNLDPNRVLDIILESFENNPSMHETFIDLLKLYKADEETICQIVGFKFQSLHQMEQQMQQVHLQQEQQQAHDSAENTHQFHSHMAQYSASISSLYTVTSYLLKYKMVDMDLLMPHLYPTDLQIQQFYKEDFESAKQYAKKLTIVNLSDSSTASGTANGKSSGSDMNAPVDHQQQHQQQQLEEQRALVQSQLNRLDNQKLSLVRSLVEIGDYKTALRIIERLPQWYLATYCDVAIDMCKAINANIVEPIYRKFNLLSKYVKEKYLNSRTSTVKSSKRSGHSEPTSDESDLLMDTSTTNSQLDEMLSTFVESVLPILSALGPGVSYDTILFTKLVRISIAFLESKQLTNSYSPTASCEQGKELTPPPQSTQPQTSSSASNTMTNIPQPVQPSVAQLLATLSQQETTFYDQIYTLVNEVLLPSLSMLSMNPCLAIELWNLLKLFPYEMRYYMFNNWRQYSYKHFPQLIRVKAECQEKIKYLLKRLTKENVKIHGRQIGKLSHNNPIIVCDYILTQIQRYDNFILPIVDSLKFLTPLSYDVLSYCTIIAISDADRDKMKHDSTSISSWLQSVATFCALTFKKYPIELTAIIQYVINQLKNKKSYDLLILQEIVQKMCGIEVLSEVNDLQLEAMAGGDLLRQEAGYFNPIRNIKKCANRLKEALADHGLILPLCILLSQQRDYIVFADQAEREQQSFATGQFEKRHLKLTGHLYDQCQDSLVQFSQFLSSTLTTEEYIHVFPQIDELVNVYHVSADVAFFLSRPMYAHHIQSKYDELRRMDRNTKSAEKPTKTQRYLEAIDLVMQPVIEVVRGLHTSKVWEDMSPLFYTTFWTSNMSDCFVPSVAYEKQRASLKVKLNALDDNPELTTAKKKKEKEKILIMLDKLTEEENKQKDHLQHVKARFEKEKEFWFPQKSKTKNETITVFLQLCIFSRCLFTQIDAYYCAKFIQIIHSLKTPNFSTIICYDRIFSDISYSIASLTDNEARRYGRFLLGLLETVMSWHADPAVFEAECAQFPGFLTVFRNALNTSLNQSVSANKQEQLDYENFRHVCHKWHYKLTKSFIVCLESEEYLQMRNSLIILTKILPHYPRLTGFCSALEKRVETIKKNQKDKKQDIYTLALVYLGQLKQRKHFMIDEGKFHLKDQVLAPQQSPSQPTVVKTEPGSTSPSVVKQLQMNTAVTPVTSTSATLPVKSTNVTPAAAAALIDKFKQPLNPIGKPAVSAATAAQAPGAMFVKQIAATLQSNQTTPTTGAASNSQTSKTSEATSAGSIAKTSATNSQSNGVSSAKTTSEGSKGTSATSSSSTTNGSRIIIPSSTSSSSSSTTANSPPSASKPSSRDEAGKDKTGTNGASSASSSSSKSSKRNGSNLNSSPTSSSQQQSSSAAPAALPLTPVRKKNGLEDFSPTSSVSSDEWPSPKRSSSQNQGGSRHKSHSRSSSPKNSSASGGYYTSTKSGSSSSSSDKSKRLKTDDTNSNGNKNYSSSGNLVNGGAAHEHSSSKRKSSRERTERSDKEKEKKDHRKREHSLEEADVQHKRSKSDEAKKKSSSSSSVPTSSSTSTSVAQASSKRSSKKHESSSGNPKDEFQTMNNGSGHSGSAIVAGSSSSSKHRSSGDDGRRSHDKSSHYLKDKK